MKISNFLFISLGIFITVIESQTILNPGFETNSCGTSSCVVTSLSGWTIYAGGSPRLYSTSSLPSASGSWSLELTASCTIGQTITTTPGTTYTISFSFAGVPDGINSGSVSTRTVYLGTDNSELQSYFREAVASTAGNMNWERVTHTFTASATSTTFYFLNSYPTEPSGPMIDDITITQSLYQLSNMLAVYTVPRIFNYSSSPVTTPRNEVFSFDSTILPLNQLQFYTLSYARVEITLVWSLDGYWCNCHFSYFAGANTYEFQQRNYGYSTHLLNMVIELNTTALNNMPWFTIGSSMSLNLDCNWNPVTLYNARSILYYTPTRSTTGQRVTTSSMTTSPITTSSISTAQITSSSLTTSPMTSSPMTSAPATTGAGLTTSPITSGALTTGSYSTTAQPVSQSSDDERKGASPTIIGISVLGVGLAVLLFVVIIVVVRKLLRDNDDDPMTTKDLDLMMMEAQTIEFGDVKFAKLENVTIGSLVGRGHFSEVYHGVWYSGRKKDTQVEVAAKKIKDSVQFAEFVREAQILMKLRHANIVRIFGIFESEGNRLIIMEYMNHGNVLSLLKQHKESPFLRRDDIYKILLDSASAMLYLEQNNVIHRDIAARNFMVSKLPTGVFIVKLGDFGMSRVLKSEVYVKVAEVPVKWTAPEALRINAFSTKSDVWSFGVFLWEVFTLGEEPWKGHTNFETYEEIMRGKRLAKPKDATDQMYNVMLSTWREAPEARPTFGVILTEIQKESTYSTL